MTMGDLPFVNAICVTGKDKFSVEKFFIHARDCFRDQNYPKDRCQLIVINDSPIYQVGLGDVENGIVFDVPRQRPLANLRNIALECCNQGTLAIQWDCDDWHHPERIRAQVDTFLQSGLDNPGVFVRRQLCYSWKTDTAFIRETDWCIHGTILHRVGSERYQSGLTEKEDTAFARLFEPVRCEADPAIYIRFHHGHNTTSDADVLRGFWAPWAAGQWHLADDHRGFLRGILNKYSSEEEGKPSVPLLKPPGGEK